MSQNPSSKPQFPMETIFYAVIILIGVGLRFALLGHHPLNDGEASLALQALALSRGEETVLSGVPHDEGTVPKVESIIWMGT